VKGSIGSSYFTVDASSAPGLNPGRRGFVGIEASCLGEVALGVEGFGVFAMILSFLNVLAKVRFT